MNSHFRIFLFWSENGNLLTIITDIYWHWYFHFTDTDIFILLTANFFFLNITDTDISNLAHAYTRIHTRIIAQLNVNHPITPNPKSIVILKEYKPFIYTNK